MYGIRSVCWNFFTKVFRIKHMNIMPHSLQSTGKVVHRQLPSTRRGWPGRRIYSKTNFQRSALVGQCDAGLVMFILHAGGNNIFWQETMPPRLAGCWKTIFPGKNRHPEDCYILIIGFHARRGTRRVMLGYCPFILIYRQALSPTGELSTLEYSLQMSWDHVCVIFFANCRAPKG